MKRITFDEKVGKVLRDLRLEQDLSMRELADKLGFTDSKICRIENGDTHLSLEDAIRIVNLFDTSLSELIKQIEVEQ